MDNKKMNYSQIKKDMAALIASKDNELKVFTEAEEAQQKIINLCDERMLKATVSADTEEYASARRDREAASAAAEMYRRKLEQVEAEGYTTQEEAAAVLAKIQKTQETEINETAKECSALFDEIIKKIDSMTNFVEEGNELIKEYSAKITPLREQIGTGANNTPIYSHLMPFTTVPGLDLKRLILANTFYERGL